MGLSQDVEVRKAQLDHLYGQHHNAFFGQLLAGSVAGIILGLVVPGWKIVAWLGVFSIFQATRYAFARRYHAQLALTIQSEQLRWLQIHMLGTVLSAIGWNICTLFLWPTNHDFHQVAYIVVLGATINASVAGYSSYKPSYVIYMILIFAPVILRLLNTGTQRHVVLGISLLPYIGMIIRVADRSHRDIMESIKIGIQFREQTNALQISEARFRGLSEAAFESIAIHDNGKILDVNGAAAELFGYTHEELIGMDVTKLVHPDDHSRMMQNIRDRVESPYEITGIRKDGSHVPLEVQAKIVDYKGTKVRVAAARDMTIRKQAAQQMLDLQLEQERVQLLKTFLQSSSHEFSTPLSIIQTSTYLVQHGNLSDKQQGRLDLIIQQTKRIDRLVSILQTIVKLDTIVELERKQMDVNSVIHQTVQSLQNTEEAEITLNLDDTLPSLQGDPLLLGQAIHEILKNATQYTENAGTISVHTTQDDRHISIVIEDNGIGMTEDTISHIFERFYRVDESHNMAGFGIGLSIAKKIVELHNGDIQVKSQMSKGTTFTIRLPLEPTG